MATPIGKPHGSSLYDGWTVKELKYTLRRREVQLVSAARKADLISAMEVGDACGNRSAYADWTVKQLREIIRNRRDVNVSLAAGKGPCVAALERADMQLRFPLMDLPPEIRLRVYYYAFLQRRPLRRIPRKRYPCGQIPTSDGPAYHPYGQMTNSASYLCRLSHQVRNEALPVSESARVRYLFEWEFTISHLDPFLPISLFRPQPATWLTSMSSDGLAHVQAFMVSFRMPWASTNLETDRYFAIRIDLSHRTPFHTICTLRDPPHWIESSPDKVFAKASDEVRTGIRTWFDDLCNHLTAQLDLFCKVPGVGRLGSAEFTSLTDTISRSLARD